MKRNLLLTPGPTHIPPEICAALGQPLIHHRTPQFQRVLKNVTEGLKAILQTTNDVYLIASSGTGAMEASVANLLSPGDKALTVEGGKFGERWTEICEGYGAKSQAIKVDWGQVAQPDQIAQALDRDKDIKAVFITLCETSTGVTTDVKAIAEVVKETQAVLVVDGISGIAVTEFKMDGWNVDVVVGGSNKGFMLPPGVSFVSVSAKAWKLVEEVKSSRYYFDLRKAKVAAAKTDTPFTPASGIIIAFEESLKLIQEKGMESLYVHFEKLAKGTRAAANALGLSLLADESCIANNLTAIRLPGSIDGGELVKRMRDTYGVTVAGGQGHLKGKIVRIAHMGCLDEFDMLTGIGCLEKVLREMGYSFEMGAGIRAARKIFNR